MIWLASFPRSGNTFFRNILFEVYGIESSTFHKETTYPVDDHYDQYQVVKTHLLPNQLIPDDPSIKAVYLVRDGRDSLVSMAHHRKDIVSPNSDFGINLLESIIAPKGSHFGGWSENVKQWTERADIVIRFEDLIEDPIREVEKLREIMDLPTPQIDKLPSFKDLKFGSPKYGSAIKTNTLKKGEEKQAIKFFRKGKVGGYKDDMSPEMQQLFWDIHGGVMHQMGYAVKKDHQKKSPANPKKGPYKILIESNKLFMPGNDGIKRYQIELLDSMTVLQNLFPNKWEIDLYIEGGTFLSLYERGENLRPVPVLLNEQLTRIADIVKVANEETKPYENKLLKLKAQIKVHLPIAIYRPLSWIYRNLPIRYVLSFYRKLKVDKEIDKHKKKFEQYDLIHLSLPQNFHFLKKAKNKFLVTIHDLTHKSFPEFHTKENIRLTEEGMQDIIKKNAHLLAISRSTKEDLLNEYPTLKNNKVSVIYEACNRSYFKPVLSEELKQRTLEKYNLPDCPYFLTLSTLEPRKNLLNTIKAFEKLVEENEEQDLALFICGKKGWKTNELFKNENLSKKNIFFTGFVDEEDLPVFYSNAIALCYVSIYEGFGLPPLEAMACGTTVLYGDNSSMPEVIGNAGIATKPNDVNDIKLKMKKMLSEEVRIDLNLKAIQKAHQFSWLKTAWETLNLYEQCILEK